MKSTRMKLITIILEKNGYSAVRVENGKIGLELALKEKPDFIILDTHMPGMDIIKVMRELMKQIEEIMGGRRT